MHWFTFLICGASLTRAQTSETNNFCHKTHNLPQREARHKIAALLFAGTKNMKLQWFKLATITASAAVSAVLGTTTNGKSRETRARAIQNAFQEYLQKAGGEVHKHSKDWFESNPVTIARNRKTMANAIWKKTAKGR